MACLGLCLALNDTQAKQLLRLRGDDDALLMLIQEDFEEAWGSGEILGCEFDKAWDAMHRCLTDGHLGYQNGDFPLRGCVLGGEPLYQADDYIVSYKRPEDVLAIAEALPAVSREWMQQRYYQIDSDEYGVALESDDFEYTWDNFKQACDFYRDAAARKLHVIFTVDQ